MDSIQLSKSEIYNWVPLRGIGNSGDINITANSLELSNSSSLVSDIIGQGNAGNIKIQVAGNIILDGAGSAGGTFISSDVRFLGVGNAGSIDIEAGSLFLRNSAQISSDVFSIDKNGSKGGNISISVRDLVDISGADDAFQSAISTNLGGLVPFGQDLLQVIGNLITGQAGSIDIKARGISLSNEGRLQASTFGIGNAGTVSLQAEDFISLQSNAQILSAVSFGGNGIGGTVNIKTGSLLLRDGSSIQTIVRDGARVGNLLLPPGRGQAGNINIQAQGAVTLDSAGNTEVFAGLASTLASNTTGKGGNINLTASDLFVKAGAQIQVGLVKGEGVTGNIVIKVKDMVEIDGHDLDGSPSAIISGVSSAKGNGGDIILSAQSLNLTNGGALSSSNSGSGTAGNINVNAQSIRLDTQGRIIAKTTSGNAGNISLNVQDILLMRRGSQISTSAGTAQAPGNGGNITINAPRGFLVTAPNENNDITANAFNGSGGRVNITAQGIYWFTPRSRAELARLLGTTDPSKLDPRLLPTNDITAISQGNPNLSGTVALNTLGIDPTRSLFSLPGVPLDPRTRMDERCQFGGRFSRSSFVYTGRGGFPSDPFDVLRHEESELQDSDWIVLDAQGRVVRSQESGKQGGRREVEGEERREAGVGRQEDPDRNTEAAPLPDPSPSSVTHYPFPVPSSQIIEATGWVQTPDGQVYLVADAPNGGLPGSWLPMLNCQTYRLGQ